MNGIHEKKEEASTKCLQLLGGLECAVCERGTATKVLQSCMNWKFIATANLVDMQQRLVDNVAQEKMSRSVEG